MNGLRIGPDGASGQAMLPQLVIQGPGASAPFKGAYYEQPGGAGETVEETLDVQLEGTAGEVSAGLQALEMRLELARQQAANQVGIPIYLLAQPGQNASEIWRSRLCGGWVEKCRGEAGRGGLVARLHLTRVNYWEGAEALIPLSNPHGTRVANLLKVDNHCDAGHWNYAEIDPADLPGDLPAPYRLQMCGSHGEITGWVGQIYVALNANLHPGDPLNHWLEAESAPGGTTIASGDCSNNAYKRLSWSGVGENELIWWTLERATMGLGDGRYYRPLARFYPAPAAGDLWVQLRLQQGTNYPIWQGPWQLLTPGVELQELTTLQLPPYLVNQNYLLPIYLSLWGRRPAGGSSTLGIDYLQLSPLDGWRKLVTRGLGMGGESILEDDGLQDAVYLNEGGEYRTDYLAYGAPPLLYPGHTHRLYFLMASRDSQVAEPGRGFLLRLYYRPRRRRV